MNLLLVLHNWVGYAPHGGTELHVRDIARLLSARGAAGAPPGEPLRVWALYPEVREATPQTDFLLRDIATDQEERIVLKEPVAWHAYRHDEFAARFSALLAEKRIDLVHFFHLIRYPLNLPLVARTSGARVVVSLFDHFLLCQEFNLLRQQATFCGYPEIAPESCDLCLKEMFGAPYGSQANRRRLLSEVLYHADAVHFLCEDQKQRTLSAYPHLSGREEEMVQGLGVSERLPRRPPPETPPTLPLSVASLGNITRHKGGNLILDTLRWFQGSAGADDSLPVRFHLFGRLLPPYGDALAQMAKGSESLVRLHGAYTPDQLPALLEAADARVAVFASIWPETFVLALSEAWDCGLVPVAPAIGAFAERIRHGVNGFLYDPQDPGALAHLLRDLADHPEKVAACAPGVRAETYPKLGDNIAAYLDLYRKASADNPAAARRRASLARLPLTTRPTSWLVPELRVLPHGGIAHDAAPAADVGANRALDTPRPPLPVRAWRVLRNKGVRWTLYASAQQIRLRLDRRRTRR